VMDFEEETPFCDSASIKIDLLSIRERQNAIRPMWMYFCGKRTRDDSDAGVINDRGSIRETTPGGGGATVFIVRARAILCTQEVA
jgi:hypothetical protein